MATYPQYTFDEDTDYSQVYQTVVLMYSDLNAQLGCCKSTKYQDVFNQVNTQMAVIPFDLNNNVNRYQEDVKTAYKLLYPIA